MSARVVADVKLASSLKSKAFDETSLRSEPEVQRTLYAAFAALEDAITVRSEAERV
jgi:hypothetical protein